MNDASPSTLDVSSLLAAARLALTCVLGAEASLALSFPVPATNKLAPIEQPAAGVIISLGMGPSPDNASAWLWLDAAFAVNLVDLALGGRGQVGTATASNLPSDAECGVLAYLAARALRAFEGVWVRDVSATRAALPPAAVVWPATVSFPFGAGIARLGCSNELSEAHLTVQLGWLDSLRSSDASALAQGDVLLNDELALSVTTQGLCGPCALWLECSHEVLHAKLDGNSLQGAKVERGRPSRDRLEIVWQSLTMSVSELAGLAARGSAKLPARSDTNVQLHHESKELARAELVRVGNSVGLRIRALGPASLDAIP